MRGLSGIDIGPPIVEYAYVLDDTDIRGDGQVSRNMNQIQTGPDADSYEHYLIPPAIWQKNVIDRKVTGSEYRYFSVSSWHDARESHSSVREYIMELVKNLENMTANGQTEEEEQEEQEEDGVDGAQQEGVLGEREAKRQKTT